MYPVDCRSCTWVQNGGRPAKHVPNMQRHTYTRNTVHGMPHTCQTCSVTPMPNNVTHMPTCHEHMPHTHAKQRHTHAKQRHTHATHTCCTISGIAYTCQPHATHTWDTHMAYTHATHTFHTHALHTCDTHATHMRAQHTHATHTHDTALSERQPRTLGVG